MEDKNIDKDIKILEKAIKVLTGNDTGIKLDFEGTAQAIENVLSEFQSLREFSAETVRNNAELQVELELWKKIAERLAILLFKDLEGRHICDVIEKEHCNKYTSDKCIQCIIDWTKNEVLKNE